MKYKVGDKFTVEIARVFKARRASDGKEEELYELKGFKYLVFDGRGLFALKRAGEDDKDHILTLKEWCYLRGVIAPFRDRTTSIGKYGTHDEYGDHEHICFTFDNDECMSLPDFEKGEMYKGMEPGREYTLEELEL
jgi:hypothetical protein